MVLEPPQLRESPSGQPITATSGGGGVVAFMCLDVADDSVAYPSAATPNVMLALAGEPAAAFTLQADARFALGADGVITYTGDELQVLVECVASLFTTGMIGYGLIAVALNDDLVGAVATNNTIALVRAGTGMANTGAGDTGIQVVARRLLTLQSGDTLRPLGGTDANAGLSDLNVMFLTFTIEEVAI